MAHSPHSIDELRILIQTGLADALKLEMPENLADAIRYSLLAPGQKIRPRLCLTSAEMIGLSLKTALPSAVAIEMVHCFTLIHDDLPCMDDDDFRRGQPSNHKKFGEALALLAGDGLMALAVDVFAEIGKLGLASPENFTAALKRLLWAMGPRGVIGGQASEFLLTEESAFADLEKVHRLKTGALFEASLLIPKDLAGIPDDSSQGLALAIFAKELGFAFQVADDLEDEGDGSEPSHVLFYLSPKDARETVVQRLKLARQGLEAAWGEPCEPLIKIADEVERKVTQIPHGAQGSA